MRQGDNGVGSEEAGALCVPPVAVLFSVRGFTADPGLVGSVLIHGWQGGLDCTVLAVLLHRALPADMPIELLNVAFENGARQRQKQQDLYRCEAGRWCWPRIKRLVPTAT
jgi:hypothetical protein